MLARSMHGRGESTDASLSFDYMAKAKTVYRCTECGADHAKWQGRCDPCGEWNTLVEEIVAPRSRRWKRERPPRRAAHAALAEGGSVAVAPRLRDVVGSQTPTLEDRSRRVRLRARRRHRARLDDSRRRRAGHRQVDAAAAGRGAARGERARDALRVGRGVGAAGASCAPTGSAATPADVVAPDRDESRDDSRDRRGVRRRRC